MQYVATEEDHVKTITRWTGSSGIPLELSRSKLPRTGVKRSSWADCENNKSGVW